VVVAILRFRGAVCENGENENRREDASGSLVLGFKQLERDQRKTFMTLEQLQQMLPNGLHDAKIRSITRNFEEETLILAVSMLVGLPEDQPAMRDRYRNAYITFTGVKLFVVEIPEAPSAFAAPGTVSFSADRSEAGLFSAEIEAQLAEGIDRYSLFVLDWLSCIHVAAAGVSFAWERE